MTPSAETDAVGTAVLDAADDPAIWAAPPGTTARFGQGEVAGLILGTDKKAGLYVYGLDGSQLQFLPDGLLNNVDLREGFVAADGRAQVLIAASDRGRMGVAFYLFDPAGAAGTMVQPAGVSASDVAEPYGVCMGRRGETFVVVLIAKDGQVRQYAVSAAAGGGVTAVEERRFAVGSQSEGCAVDDRLGRLYIGEEAKGVWLYDLDPASPPEDRVLINAVDNRRLTADVEGVTLLRDGDRTFLLVSSQGDSAFAVWRADAEPTYVGRFKVAAAGGIDAVSGTDGIDALGGPVGAYPQGLIVVQDDVNEGATQNFKLVDWRAVKQALGID